MNRFDDARRIAFGQVRAWLPDGRQQGDEWIALNPTRDDKKPGSFSVNLQTGAWSDFAYDDARGNDLVSLYAYLNHDHLSQLASEAGYKNHAGGIQVEAAKEILVKYDPTYFPSPADEFKPPAKRGKGDRWDGYRCIDRGVDDPPELDTAWYQKNWGEEIGRWKFYSDKRICMIVCRFIGADGKKEDRPFTLWTNGKETKWRAKALPEKYPLWNVNELAERPNDRVLLTEGQKNASYVKPLLQEYVCVGWYGGARATDKTDWEPLRGREVWFPFDADVPGRQALAKVKKIADEYDLKIHCVHPPVGVEKGWDIADAVDDGWSPDKIREHLDTGNGIESDPGFLEDNPFRFDILGYSGEHIVFYPHGSRKVVKIKAGSITKGQLMMLMDRSEWGILYAKEDGGIAWDAAINNILRRAEETPVFDHTRVRGTGAWNDGGKLVINTGENLIIDGEVKELYESPGWFVYERGKPAPYSKDGPLDTADAMSLIETLNLIGWKHSASARLLAGWMLIAPFGGAIRWRPHVWITGRRGEGKSWILEHIVNPIVGRMFGVMGFGTSTPAGIRDALRNSSLATVMDEMESDNQKYSEYIDQNLKMFREGSSGSGQGATTLHGTQDGEGRQWIVQSMALFASIGAGIKHGADRSRFTMLELGSKRHTSISEREERFKKLEEATELFTSTWVQAFHARTYNLWPELVRCIDVMSAQGTDLIGNRRDGDQIGTLAAGAWMIDHDVSATAAEAREYLEGMHVASLSRDADDKPDEELCLDEILSARIELNGRSGKTYVTVGAALSSWYEAVVEGLVTDATDYDAIRADLIQYGIKPVRDGARLHIAIGHPAIRKILSGSAWTSVYDDMLGRLSFCDDDLKGPGRFAGISKRYRDLDLKEMMDEVPF